MTTLRESPKANLNFVFVNGQDIPIAAFLTLSEALRFAKDAGRQTLTLFQLRHDGKAVVIDPEAGFDAALKVAYPNAY